ncbi:MAG: hypothetical protein L0227_13725 [Chloroflexi bacterium]|nr:hypothetical protein [Chloroflexota bacterium]
MIVICAALSGPADAGAAAADVARRGAEAGAEVQVAGVIPDDPVGDRLLIDLAGMGIGHAAVLRERARDLDAADLDLALRYLPDIRVIVVVAMSPAVVRAASKHAAWSGSRLVVVEAPGQRGEAGAAEHPVPALVADAIVLEAPASDPDGTFAGFVGVLAARLDAGATPADAWAETTRQLAVDPA